MIRVFVRKQLPPVNTMDLNVRSSSDLVDTLTFEHTQGKQKPILFLVGSGATMPTPEHRYGVPAANDIVSLIVRGIKDGERRLDFRDRINRSGGSKYQAAFDGLERHGDLGERVIRNAVLKAATVSGPPQDNSLMEDTRWRALEEDEKIWNLRPGIASIGQVIYEHPNICSRTVLTTNFDPLLEVSLRRAKLAVETITVTRDLYREQFASSSSDAARVVHLHGFWRGSVHMHTHRSLTLERPRLESWLREELTQSRLVVLGYGGWPDVVTKLLGELMEVEEQLDVHWCLYGEATSKSTSEGKLHELLSKAQKSVGRRMLTLYEQVDIDQVMPAIHHELRRLKRGTASGSTQRKAASEQVRTLAHEALHKISVAQQIVAFRNFRVGTSQSLSDRGYGWEQDLSQSGRGAPSALPTAQALLILEGLANTTPLLAQLQVRSVLERQAVYASGLPGWTAEEARDRPLARVTACVILAASRAQLALSPQFLLKGTKTLLLEQIDSSGGWSFRHEEGGPDIITTSQVLVTLASVLRYISALLVNSGPSVEDLNRTRDSIRGVLAKGVSFLERRLDVSTVPGSTEHLESDGGCLGVVSEVPSNIARVVRSAEAAVALQAAAHAMLDDEALVAICRSCLARLKDWLYSQASAVAGQTTEFTERWESPSQELSVQWGHTSQAILLRGLLASGVEPSEQQVLTLVSRLLESVGNDGLWLTRSFPNAKPTFVTKDVVLALREYVGSIVSHYPDVLLSGPRMAAIDGSHYALYRRGMFGVSVAEASEKITRKVFVNSPPFELPSVDMQPKLTDPQQVSRTRLLVDTAGRSVLESCRVNLERRGTTVHGIVLILRGGLPLYAPASDVFPEVSIGLLRLRSGTGSSSSGEWSVEPQLRLIRPRILVGDTIVNTGSTMLRALKFLEALTAYSSPQFVVCATFAHQDGIDAIAEHLSVESVQVGSVFTERDASGHLHGVGFDAGDLAMGASKEL